MGVALVRFFFDEAILKSSGWTALSGGPVRFLILQVRQAGTMFCKVLFPPFANGVIWSGVNL